MSEISLLEPVDYLIIGHLTLDQTSNGPKLGGTAAYSGLTAHALGLKVGIVTAWGNEIPLQPLSGIQVNSFPAEFSTSFENRYIDGARSQYLLHQAPPLDYYHIPEPWRNAGIVHLAPVAGEVEPGLVRGFPEALLGVTPQGWLRDWDTTGKVYPAEWPEGSFVLDRAGACVISLEDVGGDEDRIEELASRSRVLAVTEGRNGSRVYWNGDVRRFPAPQVVELDPTGAGDVYAAAFFVRLSITRDPWEAARFASLLSALSVTRPGLEGVPTPDEIQSCMQEVF